MAKYIYKKYLLSSKYIEGDWGTTITRSSYLEPSTPFFVYDAYKWNGFEFEGMGELKTVRYSNVVGKYKIINGGDKVIRYTYASPSGSSLAYEFVTLEKKLVDARGSFLEDVIAEDGTYPDDGRKGSYWYVKIELSNKAPTLTDSTLNNKTLYENDLFSINGKAIDTNVGDVVTIKYSVNNGIARAIKTAISDATPVPYIKQLQLKDGKLYDNTLEITSKLQESTQHTLKIWAEDDQGGKSVEIVRVFYVVANRPPTLIIDPFAVKENLINTDTIKISGNTSDPDGNNVAVKYKLNTKVYADVYTGKGGPFEFEVSVSDLKESNIITVQAVDSYGAITSKSLSISREGVEAKLKKSVVRYDVTPPNTKAKGMTLWIQREIGDLEVDVDISMGTTEDFKPMIKNSYKYISPGIEEDEFNFENATEESKVLLRITMTRRNVVSEKSITLVSGVFS